MGFAACFPLLPAVSVDTMWSVATLSILSPVCHRRKNNPKTTKNPATARPLPKTDTEPIFHRLSIVFTARNRPPCAAPVPVRPWFSPPFHKTKFFTEAAGRGGVNFAPGGASRFFFRGAGSCAPCSGASILAIYTALVMGMPAIRFLYNNTYEVASPTEVGHSGYVLVRLHGGKEQRFPIIGFICKAGTKHLPQGSYAKVLAAYVTHDESIKADDWIKLEANQVVAGWRVQFVKNQSVQWGVYIVVDETGCPLVVVDKTYSPPPDKKSARVLFIDKSKKEPKTNTERKDTA